LKRYSEITKSEEIYKLAKLDEECYCLITPTGRFLYEAIIDVDPEVETIIQKVKEVKNKIFQCTSIDSIISMLNKLLASRKIKFGFTRGLLNEYIAYGGFIPSTQELTFIFTSKIQDFIDKDIDKNVEFKQFLNSLQRPLGHELIHREQFLKVAYEEKRKEIFKKSSSIKDKYYSNKHEMMSYAWQIINEFRMNGIEDSSIKKILATKSEVKLEIGGPILKDYHKYFPGQEVLKGLYKYMYMYLD
jgi:hypothetical protein